MQRALALAMTMMACSAPSAPAPPAPPPQQPQFALPDHPIAESSLGLAVASGAPVIVTPSGAVQLGDQPIELAALGARLAASGAPPEAWQRPGGAATGRWFDGSVLIRVAEVRDRPIAVVDRDASMLRLLEVTRAAQPVGLAIAVTDRVRPGPRVFAFRVTDPRDAGPVSITDPIRVTIDRHRIHVESMADPPRNLPLGGEPDALHAAMAAIGRAGPWGVIQLIGGTATVSTALAVVEAMAGAGVTGVLIEAGAPGVPSVAVGEPIVDRGTVDPRTVRRYIRQSAAALVRCYADLGAAPAGTAELSIEVAADGKPTRIDVAPSGLDPAIGPCLTGALAATALWSGKPAAVTVPLAFEPDGGPLEFSPRRR